MNEIKTGGPAFPATKRANAVSMGKGGGANYEMEQSGGMTLRDYFAAKAMQGFMANKSNPMLFNPEADAHYAYIIADAMIKAREAKW